MQNTSSTRRGFLAVAGGALLAGCGGFNPLSADSDETIPSYRLPDVTEDGESELAVVDTIPVTIEQERLAATAQRVADLLGTLPMPFGPEEVPNGHIRHRLIDAATEATEHVEEARTAKTRLSAFQSLREARGEARYAAAGWAFVEGETTREELETEHSEIVNQARSVRADHEYLGDDIVDAALVHAHIERNLAFVLDDQRPSVHNEESNLLTVAEWGDHAESSRAHLDDSRYLYDQFTSSLPTDPDTVEETLTTAAESASTELQRRREELPPEPTEDDRELVWRLQYRLRDDAESSAEYITNAPGPASAVMAAANGFTDFLAYDRIQNRIENGEQFRTEDATDVRKARSQALEAIQTALERSPRTGLARPILADAAVTVAFADETLSRYQGDVHLAQLDDPVRRYTIATVRARSVPTACQQVLEILTT